MIKAALFDVDDVLNHSEYATAELERRYGIPEIQSQEFFRNEWDKCLVGKADSKHVLKPYLKKWNWPGSVEDYLKFWFEYEHNEDGELLAYIQDMRRGGVACYLATNQDINRATYILENMGFAEAFDGAFISSKLGVAKPDHKFFQAVLNSLSCEPQEIVFWDDREENIVAAQQCGMHAEIYINFADFSETMASKYNTR